MPSPKTHTFTHLPLSTSGPQPCALTGPALLQTPYLNKGSAFPSSERKTFHLESLLPAKINTLSEQISRAYAQYATHKTDLGKNTFLASMKEQNEILYYALCQTHLKEMFPVIYTPTEGEAIKNFSRLFRRPEGCFLHSDMASEEIETAMARFGGEADVDVVVVSDGEQILGIGDQGVGGILISIAKLVLYTLCAGIHPTRTLPVVLDVGTDNAELLNDELYLGLQKGRMRGEGYDAFVEKFVTAVRRKFPRAYLHFEDFGVGNARRLLGRYSDQLACFNDDVQGTGCVTLAAIYAAAHVAGYDISELRVICFGSGSAGTGIADQIRDAIAVEGGKSGEEAAKQIFLIDKPGLLVQSRKEELMPAQHPYAKPDEDWRGTDPKSLLEIVKHVKPHVLIGTSTQPKAFTKEIVQEMAKHVERPIIFPLSNPTRLHEADPRDLYAWTEGKVLCASGSPFPPVEMEGGKKREIAECTTFPGIGLGVVLGRSKLLTKEMLVAAVKALAAQAPALKDPDAALLPDVGDVREISVKIAAAVIQQAVQDGLAREKEIPSDGAELEEWIREQMWVPEYRPLEKVDPGDASRAAKGEAGSKGRERVEISQ
ncbi:malic oxidoreductase [Lecanosticta acicola]|uniref:Malic enzyme n=1 Tax=Lecanosticta acicola TaxID=111012 RepID=A0AAI9EAV0_9PEZI|nr:malic oxidoreductase [Lecanosticta acicola]